MLAGSLIVFTLGVILLVYSTQAFVRRAEHIAAGLKISPLVIGVTIVAIGTSLPEFIVSVFASVSGDTGLASGNIIGSNIINILLVLPVASLAGKLRIGTKKTQKSTTVLFLVTILYILIHIYDIPNALSGLLLLFCALFFTLAEYRWGVTEKNEHTSPAVTHELKKRDMVHLLADAAGLAVGGLATVLSIESLAIATGISSTVFGLTLTATATSMPELLSSIIAQRHHDGKLTIGNIIGSNIYNLLLIGGVVRILGGDVPLPAIDWTVFMLVMGGFFVMVRVFESRIIPRWTSVMLLGCFLGYILIQANLIQ